MDHLSGPIFSPSVAPAPPEDIRSSPLDMDSPYLESSAAKASSATLFFGSPSLSDVDTSGSILGGPLVARLDSVATSIVERKQGAIWLAATPLSFFSTLRYSRRDRLNYEKVAVIETVPPINGIEFRPETLGTLGWKAYEHPEGSVYFRAANFYTNLWLYDATALEAIEDVVDKIRAELASFPELSGKDIEFGLDMFEDDEPGTGPGDTLGCYYAVDMTSREVFWLQEVASNFYCDDTELKIISREHLRYGARMSYWWNAALSDIGFRDHCYMFPHGRSLPPDMVSELRAVLSYNMFDKTTSTSSVSPYNEDDAHHLFQMFREMKASGASGHYIRPEQVVMTARMQSTFMREKLLHFHGERYAQLDSNKSVFEEDPKDNHRSGLFRALSLVFFWGPHVYYEQLSRTWVDNKVNYDSWRNFVGGLQADWTAYIIPSLIILTANVGFFAIESIDQGGFVATDRTFGQTASYISTFLNIGCVAASLGLAEQHRLSSHRTAEAAVTYLCGRALSKGGVERLAVIFSIPAAFFRWGLVSLATAMFCMSLQETSGATRIAVCIVAGISMILLLVTIVCNGEWKARFSTSPLATGVKQVRRLVKRASVMVATRPTLFSMPKTSILPK
ncbi:hypothetical protein V8D89_012324 [Ganoderma adspersum]